MYDQKFFVTQEIKSKFFIIYDVEFLCIDLREHIKCCLWFYGTDTWIIGQSIVDIFSLLINTTAGNDITFHALMTAESSLHNGLCRYVGT